MSSRRGCTPGIVLCSLTVLSSVLPIKAKPNYPGLLPNGARVPCPSFFTDERAADECHAGTCDAIGHTHCKGGDYKEADGTFLNPFGEAFRLAGYNWTPDLCQADSDGDGLTNGQELGDPCCVWTQGMPVPNGPDYVFSHPGYADDVADNELPSQQECAALRDEMGPAEGGNHTAIVESLYEPGEDERFVIDVNITEHTLLPNETIYGRTYYSAPTDQPYYLVGTIANIDNALRTHHFILYVCTVPREEITDQPEALANPPGVVYNPQSPDENGYIPPECQQSLVLWAPGAEVFKLPPDFAIELGSNTPYKSFFLEVHYNNVEGVTNETDASSLHLYTTLKPRENLASWLWTGSITSTGTIPPRSTWYSSTSCVVNLAPECDSVDVIGFGPHAHLLGTNVFSEHHSHDKFGRLTYAGDLGRASDFSYDNQAVRFLDPYRTINQGDMLTGTCLYKSDRDVPTPGGLASQEEMCIGFLLVHPARCVPSMICGGVSAAGPLPDSIEPRAENVSSGALHTIGTAPDFGALLQSGDISCNNGAMYGQREAGMEAMENAWLGACPFLTELMPETLPNTTCPEACMEYLLNVGACVASGRSQIHNQMAAENFGFAPLPMAPPQCLNMMTAKLVSASNVSEAGSGEVTAEQDAPSAVLGLGAQAMLLGLCLMLATVF